MRIRCVSVLLVGPIGFILGNRKLAFINMVFFFEFSTAILSHLFFLSFYPISFSISHSPIDVIIMKPAIKEDAGLNRIESNRIGCICRLLSSSSSHEIALHHGPWLFRLDKNFNFRGIFIYALNNGRSKWRLTFENSFDSVSENENKYNCLLEFIRVLSKFKYCQHLNVTTLLKCRKCFIAVEIEKRNEKKSNCCKQMLNHRQQQKYNNSQWNFSKLTNQNFPNYFRM